MSGTDSHTAGPPSSGQGSVNHLKEQIASRAYRVDSRAVAREMLFKMRMMAVVRERSQRRSWSNPDGARVDPSE
jgi:hypothetical protein